MRDSPTRHKQINDQVNEQRGQGIKKNSDIAPCWKIFGTKVSSNPPV